MIYLKTEAEEKLCVGFMHTPCSLFFFYFLLCFFFSFVYYFFFNFKKGFRASQPGLNLAMQEDDELIFLPLLVKCLQVLVFAISGSDVLGIKPRASCVLGKHSAFCSYVP